MPSSNNQRGGRPRLEQAWPIRVRNVSSELAPPFALLKAGVPSQANSEEVYNVSKPLGATGAFFVNGPIAIPPSGYGSATAATPAIAQFNPFDGTPAPGQEWGPNPLTSSWYLSASGKGFPILGGAVSEGTPPNVLHIVRVAFKGGSSEQAGDVPVIFVRNDTGLTLQSRSVVGIGAPLVVPVGSIPPPGLLPSQGTFASAAPAPGFPFAITLAPLAPTQIGEAVGVGLQQVLLNFQNHVHTRAVPINGDYTKLNSYLVGPSRIVWRALQGVQGAGSLGLQWAVVEMLGSDLGFGQLRGYAAGTIGAASGIQGGNITPGVGFVKLYNQPTGQPGTAATPGDLVEVENWMHGTIGDGKPCHLRSGRWHLNSMIFDVISEGCSAVPLSGGGGP